MAGTQPIEKFLSKPDFGGPSGLFIQGNPSIEPPTSIHGFPWREETASTPNIRISIKTHFFGWLPEALILQGPFSEGSCTTASKSEALRHA